MLRDVFVWSCWINAALSAAMAGFVLSPRPQTGVKLGWGLVCLSTAAWSAGLGVMTSTGHRAVAELGSSILQIGSTFIPVFLVQTIHSLRRKRPKGILFVAYLS